MKRIFTNLTLAIIFLLSAVSLNASGQASTATPAPFSTPTATTPIPTQASDANLFLCAGSPIKLAPTVLDPTATKFQWYKYDPSGNAILVQSGSSSAYTLETTPATGYYKYKLVQINSNDCSSPASQTYVIYVLPPLNPQIASSNATICANQSGSTSALTITGLDPNYAYTYRWSRNGVDIADPEGSLDHYTASESTVVTDVVYKVLVSYKLKTDCSAQPLTKITAIAAPQQPTITFTN